MAAQKGREVLIKVEDTPGGGTYTAMAGLRAKQFTLNNGETDLSDSDDDWAQTGIGFGLKSVRLSGSGIYKNHATQRKIVTAILTDATLNYQMVVPGLGTFAGAFVASSIDMGANHDGELGFSTQFMSNGEVTFTPSA